VPTLARPVKIKVPGGTQSGQKFRVGGKGMPKLRAKDKYGNLYARVLITVPDELNPEQEDLLHQLRDTFD
jgi:molecular chaperone DnaJ